MFNPKLYLWAPTLDRFKTPPSATCISNPKWSELGDIPHTQGVSDSNNQKQFEMALLYFLPTKNQSNLVNGEEANYFGRNFLFE